MSNMIKLNYKDTIHLDEKDILDVSSTLYEYIGTLSKISRNVGYEDLESFLQLPNDKELIEKSQSMAAGLAGTSLKYVIVVGIGGSNLGAMAVYDALYSKFDILTSRRPKLIFSDTTNPREMEALKKVIDENIHGSKEIVLNIITKSGTTAETVANGMFLFDILSNKFSEKEAIERTVITTDEESTLWNIAREKNIRVLPIPKKVGGRYSIFSPVGLFPLRLVGVNISEFIAGAVQMMNASLTPNIDANPALKLATIDFLQHKKKLTIYNNFFFNSELESVGKWGRQLVAESLGKRFDTAGNSIYAGLTPIVSIGSTDLHSMVQLYLGGPRDKFTNFIYAESGEGERVSVPKFSIFQTLVPDVVGKDYEKILSSILVGTMEAYKEKAFPYIETILPRIDENSLGQYFMLKMIETVLLGKLWNVNAFDQPEVESYKKVARELMKS